AARASGFQVVPVIAAAAPITAFRIRNERRSTPAGIADSDDSAKRPSLLEEVGAFISLGSWFRRLSKGSKVMRLCGTPERASGPKCSDPVHNHKEGGVWI